MELYIAYCLIFLHTSMCKMTESNDSWIVAFQTDYDPDFFTLHTGGHKAGRRTSKFKFLIFEKWIIKISGVQDSNLTEYNSI